MSNIKYSIICCYYNEINVLKKKFVPLLNEIKNLPFSFEIFICDNNSNDGSKEFLKEIEAKQTNGIKFVYNEKNLGKGGSIKKCISLSKGEFIVIFDVDEYLIDDLIKADNFLNINKQTQFLVGSRVMHQKRFIYKKNYYGVRIMTMLINFLYKTKISDSAGATKIFKKEIYDGLSIATNGFNFEFEVLCKFAKKGYDVSEFPIEYFPRSIAEGKKLRAFKDGSLILWTILKNYF